ncbi:MAG TPA: condensation domain-containing protein, partial [Thermoanaerobaculia bacterium]|nr:condensation domain-containing protein [Thermoanaerobaculia bacterium]
ETIRAEGITTMALPPPILATIPPENLPSLCTILVGGDRCSADLANRWVPPGSTLRLLNCYGPTETTIYSGFQRCAGPYRRDPSIGRPIANLHMAVLDPRGRLAPVGVPGELCVGGAGTVRGYLHRPDLTAQRFVPDPFGGEPGGRLYRSGDLVRLLPHGEIEFLGRIDRQVKLRGLRIELGEIEALLAAHPAVRECAVVVREDAPGEKALVAYLVPQAEPAPEASGLRTFLAAKLPSYMVPTAFVTLEALPLSPTGKVDHAALPAPSRERSGGDVVAARNQAEATLAGIWSQVLGVEKVGIHDNFFDLGGDSILCIQVVSRAQQEGLWLTARDLFRHQTVAELAALAATAGAGPEASVDEEAGAEVPLTPVQRLFFDLDLEDPHHFNQAVLLALQQEADPGRLERALGAVAALHSALRYRYLRDGEGQWHQVATDMAAPLAVLDLSALPQARRRAALEGAAARLQPSLDLTRGPLLRAALFALGEEGQRLLLVLHHLIVDGVSWRILLGDLETAYRSLAAGASPALPPVATPFARWAAKLAEHAGSAAAKEELPYWLAPARAAVLPLPVDLPGGAADDTLGSAGSVIAELDPEATRALLQDVPKAYHTQINDVLLTALAEAFAGWTGQPHLLVDLEGHGREELFEGFDVSRTVGWFTSLFPVLLQLPDSDSAAAGPGDHLKAVKEQLRAVPRGGVGYGLLRYAGDEEAAGRLREMPPAEVVFNYLGQLDRGLAGSALFAPAGESSGPALSPRQRRGHLLEINGGIVATDAGSSLRLTWTYGVNRHHRHTIQALADRFIASLRGLIEHCRAKESGDFTPSDFPEARFSQKDLDTLMARIGKRSPGAGARRTGPR